MGTPIKLMAEVNFYSESSTDTRTDNPVIFNRLQYEIDGLNILGKKNKFYLGTGFTQDGKTEGSVIYNDNYSFVSAGSKYSLTHNLVVFAEFRQIVEELNTANLKSKQDYRGGAYFYLREDLVKLHLFHEHYSELIFSNRQHKDTFFMVRSRIGHAKKIIGNISAEILGETKLKLDRIGHYYENKFEIGPMLRLRARFSQFSIDLIGGHIVGVYLGRQAVDPLPQDKSYTNWQGLLALNGTF